jgi:hypothetical protein
MADIVLSLFILTQMNQTDILILVLIDGGIAVAVVAAVAAAAVVAVVVAVVITMAFIGI